MAEPVQPITGIISKSEMNRSNTAVRLNINGRWYSSKKMELMQMTNQMIQFVPSLSTHQGKTYYWINEYSPVHNDLAPTTQPAYDPQPATQPAPSPPVPPSPDQQTIDPMPLLPMTSNLVAHAIQAGHVNSPDEIDRWVQAAFASAKRVVYNINPAEFDDDIPF